MIFRDDAHLQERLSYWQGVLRLQDWDIVARIVSNNALQNKCYGNCDKFDHGKRALIQIMDAEGWNSYDARQGIEYDQERVLVHELVHIPFSKQEPQDMGSVEYALFEEAIDQMARAFVRLDRK